MKGFQLLIMFAVPFVIIATVAFFTTSEFESARARVFRAVDWLWTPKSIRDAESARQKRYESLVVEHLTYGYDRRESEQLAWDKMRAEAKAAAGMKP